MSRTEQAPSAQTLSPAAASACGPLALYDARITAGQIRPDPVQRAVAEKLDAVWQTLSGPASRSRLSFLSGLSRRLPFGKPAPAPEKRGLYIVGDVGRGKTMLMDLFFSCVAGVPKRRMHFLTFMEEVHRRLKALRTASPDKDDPIPPLARQIASEATVLCFDEFQINDIADAMILGRLSEALFREGVLMVTTSNTAPSDLFRNRPGAASFRPFIAIIERYLETCELESPVDYRQGREPAEHTWIVPADDAARRTLDAMMEHYGTGYAQEAVMVQIGSRALPVNAAQGPVARFTFTELCDAPLGPGDFLALAARFPVLILENVPALPPEQTNAARRFVTLIDALYDSGTLLFASSDVEPAAIFPDGEGAGAFLRTVSRLAEMSSISWQARLRPGLSHPAGS